MKRHLLIGGSIAVLALGLTGCAREIPLGAADSAALAVDEHGVVYGESGPNSDFEVPCPVHVVVSYDGTNLTTIQEWRHRYTYELTAANDRGVAVGTESFGAPSYGPFSTAVIWKGSSGTKALPRIDRYLFDGAN